MERTPGDLQVVVAGAADGRLAEFAYELSRVRASLLYGDSVALISPKALALEARMLWKMRTLPGVVGGLVDAAKIDELELGRDVASRVAKRGASMEIPDELVLEFMRAAPDVLAELLRKKVAEGQSLTVGGLTEVAVENYLRSFPEEDSPQVRAALSDLLRLQQENVLRIDTDSATPIATSEFVGVDDAFQVVLEELVDLISNPTGREHPLLSDDSIRGVREQLDAGAIVETSLKYANRTEIAARLIATVPGFPDASIDELLDVRERTAPLLADFRSAVAEFEDGLEVSVVGDGFDEAFQDIYLRRVAPALAALEQSLKDEGAYPTLLRGVPRVAAGTVALGAAIAVEAPALAGATALAAGALSSVANELLARRKIDEERRRNRLFLLFEAKNQLG